MKTYRFKQVDAFTSKSLTGNYAGVVYDADTLSDKEMQLIAREVNLPETAFILRPTITDADLKIRWFTPTTEVPLCGHATIAAFHALAEDGQAGMTSNGQHYFRLQTKSGLLPVKVEKNFCTISVEFELPHPKFSVRKSLPTQFWKAVGLNSKVWNRSLPTVISSYIYVPIQTLRQLQKAEPDFCLLASLLRTLKVKGACLFTLETLEHSSAIHSRFFAPHIGINEDPVTGSANGPLGVYLFKYVLPAGISIPHRELPDGKVEFIGEQGDSINRSGRVKIRLQVRAKTIERVSIAGEAKTIITGTISI